MKIFCESPMQEDYLVVLLFANTDNCQIKTLIAIVNTEHVLHKVVRMRQLREKKTKITTKKFILLSESVDEKEINCDRKYKTHTLVVAGTTQTSPWIIAMCNSWTKFRAKKRNILIRGKNLTERTEWWYVASQTWRDRSSQKGSSWSFGFLAIHNWFHRLRKLQVNEIIIKKDTRFPCGAKVCHIAHLSKVHILALVDSKGMWEGKNVWPPSRILFSETSFRLIWDANVITAIGDSLGRW